MPALRREPDLVLRQEASGLSVALNRSSLPSLQIDPDAGGAAGGLAAARALQRMVEARNATLLRVGFEVATRQQEAFRQGLIALEPMSMADVAEALDLHESTISRVVAGSSIDTPRGTWWLRALFSQALGGNGQPVLSGASLRQRLARLIAADPADAPRSDAALATALAEETGITLARRTVAKYREDLGIPPAHRRRRKKLPPLGTKRSLRGLTPSAPPAICQRQNRARERMAYFLGVDTGGTYTDAVILDEAADQVIGSAKSLTTRGDLALGIGRAVDAALAQSGVSVAQVALVSLSTTLATNALVEGQGGRVALIFVGFDAGDLERGGLTEALKGDPVVQIAGGHSHAGHETATLDLVGLEEHLRDLGPEVMGFAVAARFATRNPAHELAIRDLIRRVTQRPVTCSHELSAQLNGPKRALTAVLNARLIGMIDRLVTACESHLAVLGIKAPLMVVRGDGALISAAMVRERPIETILSGPAASIVGARWLTGARDALVSDIGGTTTDVALLAGRPARDRPARRQGRRVSHHGRSRGDAHHRAWRRFGGASENRRPDRRVAAWPAPLDPGGASGRRTPQAGA